MKRIILFLALLPLISLAMPNVRVDGLFNGRAVVTINGKQHLLKEGERSPEGVLLISSDSKKAVLEVEGKTLSLGLSELISANYTAAEEVEVRIPRDPRGHYFVGGFINGRAVDFMVDTGATSIAMNRNDADRLGIDLRRATSGNVSTANGIVSASMVKVSKVTIGGIVQHQVPVTVVNSNFPETILLGNSFLSRVEMREEKGVLVLLQKY